MGPVRVRCVVFAAAAALLASCAGGDHGSRKIRRPARHPAPDAAAAPAPAEGAADGPRVSISCDGEPISKVLRRIAAESKVNIVCDPDDVNGRVTVHIQDRPWREALEAVAAAVGCVVVDDGGGIVRVLTRERAERMGVVRP